MEGHSLSEQDYLGVQQSSHPHDPPEQRLETPPRETISTEMQGCAVENVESRREGGTSEGAVNRKGTSGACGLVEADEGCGLSKRCFAWDGDCSQWAWSLGFNPKAQAFRVCLQS